jgi:predicted RNA-binding protein (TIGR00451 family)
MPEVQVDKGAIRFVLGGANIMCPGLTSKGGRMEEELPAETAVVRYSDRMRERGKAGKEGHVTKFPASHTMHRRSARRGRRWCWL